MRIQETERERWAVDGIRWREWNREIKQKI